MNQPYFSGFLIPDTRRVFRFLVAALAIMLLFFLFDYNQTAHVLFDAQDKLTTRGVNYLEDPRFIKFQLGLAAIAQSPILGYGFDGYVRVIASGSSHNAYIEKAVNGGLIAFVAFALFFIDAAMKTLRRLCHTEKLSIDRTVDASRVLILFTLLIYMMVLNVHYLVAAYVFFGLVTSKVAAPVLKG
ncbi:O-antigen ligase family protein [Desulfobulbus alkaliphilus]|uniref:O-antigen ligase family protein n=1 Tax=Desulfobulbus alkaliphilus TaxID=869814 RepID=UPI001963BFA5|nr:O-antigen ligase family protein [Desulfobulbus alkaliphilus]MBM9538641.1 O-antigen ligase family protein [Desulfobulbus alkaliphilus]